MVITCESVLGLFSVHLFLWVHFLYLCCFIIHRKEEILKALNRYQNYLDKSEDCIKSPVPATQSPSEDGLTEAKKAVQDEMPSLFSNLTPTSSADSNETCGELNRINYRRLALFCLFMLLLWWWWLSITMSPIISKTVTET